MKLTLAAEKNGAFLVYFSKIMASVRSGLAHVCLVHCRLQSSLFQYLQNTINHAFPGTINICPAIS